MESILMLTLLWNSYNSLTGYGPSQRWNISWQLLPIYPNNLSSIMAGNVPHNMFKNVSHIIKNCRDNFQDYQYEFLGVMEQLSLKTMVDAPNGQVLTLSILVSYNLFFFHSKPQSQRFQSHLFIPCHSRNYSSIHVHSVVHCHIDIQ